MEVHVAVFEEVVERGGVGVERLAVVTGPAVAREQQRNDAGGQEYGPFHFSISYCSCGMARLSSQLRMRSADTKGAPDWQWNCAP